MYESSPTILVFKITKGRPAPRDPSGFVGTQLTLAYVGARLDALIVSRIALTRFEACYPIFFVSDARSCVSEHSRGRMYRGEPLAIDLGGHRIVRRRINVRRGWVTVARP
jgi:hypothetical protein